MSTWDPYEVTEAFASDPDLCMVAEESASADDGDDDASEITAPSTSKPKSRIVGFVLGSITEKRKKDQSCGYLCWVAVREKYRRKGIGTFLVRKMMSLFWEEEIRQVIVDTPAENHPAIRFLKGLGFTNPVHHVYMSLNISGGGAGAVGTSVPEKRPAVKPTLAKAGNSSSGPSGGSVVDSALAKSIRIRPMAIDDLSPVYELGEAIYPAELYPNLFRIWSEAEVVESFGKDAEYCFVAEMDHKVVGFSLGTTIEKRGSAWRYGYLVWLGVAPEAQRYGVGRRLFNHFKDIITAAACRIIMVDTQADNQAARRFFEKAGFGGTENHVYFSRMLTKDPKDDVVTAAEGEAADTLSNSLPAAESSNFLTVKSKAAPFRNVMRFKRGNSLSLNPGDLEKLLSGKRAREEVEKEEEDDDDEEEVAKDEGKKRSEKGVKGKGSKKVAAAAPPSSRSSRAKRSK